MRPWSRRTPGVRAATGIGVASPSLSRYYVGKACSRLTGTAGIDDVVGTVGPEGGTSTFQVVGDGKVLFDGGYNDRADWAAPTATC